MFDLFQILGEVQLSMQFLKTIDNGVTIDTPQKLII